jgi:hypoxanthine phosphoribosyltransferase
VAAVRTERGGTPVSDPRVLISEQTITAKISELAQRISSDYEGVEDLVLVGVLKGSFIFLADLSRRLTVPRSVDFMALSTYGNST